MLTPFRPAASLRPAASFRCAAVAVAACAVGLSLAACTAGITHASPPAPPAPSAGHTTARSSAPASPSPSASPADTITVDAPIHGFPVPHGAQVITNQTCDKEVLAELGGVTVSQASSFYSSVLPKDGYKITGNTLLNTAGDGLSGPAAEIQFTGHGYKGTITALSNMASAMASAGVSASGLPSYMNGTVITIDLLPPGAAGCSTASP